LNQRMTQTRRSLSPSRVSDQFKQLRRGNAHAAKEKQVSELVIPIIEGKIPDVRCRAGGVPFNNFDPLTDVTLKHANPDIYYGALPEELSRKVRDELCGRIIPSTQHNLPMVPNFFVETKGPDGSIAVAKRQACYNGAFGARSMHSLKMYGKSPDVYDNKACTVTSTFHDGNLKLYTSHIALSHTSSNRPVYYMNQLGAYSLTGSKRIFIEGVTAYRNMRDWTEEQRSEAIQNANARVEAEANHIEAGALADGGASPAASFVTAVDADEVYTMTQEEYGLPPDEDDVEGQLESDSSDGATSVYTFPAKRSKSKGQHHPRRKRHNADASSSLTSISQDPVGVGATTKQSGTWSWVNGKFQNYHGQDRLKEQHNNPVDVWVYFEGGWPGQKGEKWRWVSATGETKYS
jgi:hypothetical protein